MEKTHLLITLPSTVKWSDYEKEIDAVSDWSAEMNFKVSSVPKRVDVGSRCYVCHDGAIRGWMEISGFEEKEFECTTTGEYWKGKFVKRSGPFHYIEPIPYKGFQGFRYVTESELGKIV